MIKQNWCMDLETMIDCFVACFIDSKSDEIKIFSVCKLRNDFDAFVEFLHSNIDKGEYHISFNGLAFDAQITHKILKDKDTLRLENGEIIAHRIYEIAQNVIQKSEQREFQEFPEWKMTIKQVDIFKLNHWDNPAKMSSLKWIQYTTDWENVQDMPIHHSTQITTQSQLDEVIKYCTNDVLSTKHIMKLCKDQIILRRDLSNEYNLNLRSASEPKISRDLFVHFLYRKTGIDKRELRKYRTKRGLIKVSEILVSYLKFDKPEFKKVHEEFKGKIIDAKNLKGAIKFCMWHKNVKTDFGLGGIHGARKSGIYEAKNGMIIMSSDVVSFYPNLAIRNKWAPAHLPKKDFCDVYEWFFEERKKLPKSNPKNYVYKIVLNSTYGLSIEENSPLYDPQLGMQITINGQLSLIMLYEMLSTGIQGSLPLLQNTDGLEMIIPVNMKDKYMEICKEWENITQLQLEHDQYQKIVLRDVNNYLAINIEKKVKAIGMFAYAEMALPKNLHKNKSYLVIAKALHAFFVDNITPEAYLDSNNNILDYCAGIKSKGSWRLRETCAKGGEITTRWLQKIVRYYMSRKGCKIIKVNKQDAREISTEAGKWLQTEYNVHTPNKPFNEYDINKEYYLQAIYKEISNINSDAANGQIELFS